MKGNRLHELDSMRAIAALGVICWHYVNSFNTAPFGHVLFPFYHYGYLMVDFFFVLSGFVLTRAFWNANRERAFMSNIIARIGRLYPLHLFTLFAVAGLQLWLIYRWHQNAFVYVDNTPRNFLLHLLLLQASGLQQGASFNAPSWSISSEFIVNIVFLAIVAMPRRFTSWIASAVAIAAVVGLLRQGIWGTTLMFGVIDPSLIRTAAGFFVGVALYKLYANFFESKALVAARLWAAAALLVAAGLLLYLWRPAIHGKYQDIAICLVGFPAMILTVLRSPPLRKILSARPLAHLGEISYSIYLMHFPIMLAIHASSVALGIPIPYESRWFFIGFLALLIAVASATYKLIEIPGKRLFQIKRTSQTLSLTVAS